MNSPKLLELAMEIAFPPTFLQDVFKKFGPEKARACAMSTSVGGIGPLLKERIYEQGEAGIDTVGVTLLYESVWMQAWHEWGQINLQRRNVGHVLRQMLTPTTLGFKLDMFDGTVVDVEVWQLHYGKAIVYFLACPDLADVVYPGPRDASSSEKNPEKWAHVLRLKQSWLVGRGALALCKQLNRAPDITILSETPTLFAHHRLVSDGFQEDPFFASTKYIFNDHTPLEYAHPIWDDATLSLVHMDAALYHKTLPWNAAKKTLDVTALLVNVCEGVYGVAKKHGAVMRAMPSLKPFEKKILYVTNGVARRDWQSPEFSDISRLSDEEVLERKKRLREALLDWLWRRCGLWPQWAKEASSLKVVTWTRRITGYKRLDIFVQLLKEAALRQRFVEAGLIMVIGGRIHQQDNQAQDIVYELVELLEAHAVLRDRVIILDNFNIWEAPMSFQGADGSMMIADDNREASATGFMKAQMNGAAVIATDDGAVPEFVFFDTDAPADKVNGFKVPYVKGQPTPTGLLEAFERFSLALREPARAARLIRAAVNMTSALDVARTVDEMKQLYSALLPK